MPRLIKRFTLDNLPSEDGTICNSIFVDSMFGYRNVRDPIRKKHDVISMGVDEFEMKVLQGNLEKNRSLRWCIETNWKSSQYGKRSEIKDYLLSKNYMIVENTPINIKFAERHHFDFNVRV